ncbi:hypothetical protein MN116_007988 [Schistosoma mekongi]|uniref:Integrator complex subunit 4 n=1 Tax=Schistosoma mekongi TaxID=38744 RepID=A0AAE2D2K8_SCHME|nr:hypothetical protein MN116_007988 [Schistosoma mekongi]
MLFSECEKFLTKLRSLPTTATQELSVLGVINEAFTCSSAHIRSGCLDLLAAWNSPHTCLSAGSAGEVVLWHTKDSDPRVRDRAFHCLLTWLCSLNTAFKPNEINYSGKTKYFGNFKESTKKELTLWFEANLESVYSAACQGLLDNEELVRRTSLHVLGKLSTIWPHHSLVEVPVSDLNLSVVSSKPCFDIDLEEIRLVDDAFIRVCCKIQDPSRSVRQLAAHIMADLAKFVTENCLLQTLEKTVMSDRQIRRSMIEQDNKSRRGNNMRSTPDNRVQTKSLTSDSINLISSGPNGAIISGLEDDYFEIRCTTLATVTHIASINTRFALSCQDLLVDMLTDDIQDVRLAAVRALSAVGDKVPVKGEQVSIITSALAEGSSRIRRRLHHLLSHCRLASAPCLISLLDGLLQNLRRYPEDRDNLWRCAASVGRNHPVFVETCLSSLLRTHSWLNGPEPVKEDPAYLTVLLLVLNAEPSIPGMLAKFPRHVTSTKIYLQELLPSLLPKTEFQNVSALDMLNKKLESDVDSSLKLSSVNMVEHCSLHKFTASTICRIRNLFTTIHDELSCYCRLSSVKQNNVIEDKANNIHLRIPCYKYQSRRNALLSRLIFNDLLDCVKKLDHIGKLKNLLYWLMLISTTGWYLVSAGLLHFRFVTSSSSSSSITSFDAVNYGVNFCLDDKCKEKATNPLDERIIKLLSKALRNSLKIHHLFSGKTKLEYQYVLNVYMNTLNLFNLFIKNYQFNYYLLINALYSIIKLLSNSINNQYIDHSIQLPSNRKHSLSTQQLNESIKIDDSTIIDYLIDLSKRLIPVYAILLQPSNSSSSSSSSSSSINSVDINHSIMNVKSNISWNHYQQDDIMNENDTLGVYTDHVNLPTSFHHTNSNVSIPEIRFTAIIASAMIRIRAIIIGLNIDIARKHICIIFRRPDPLISYKHSMNDNMNSSTTSIQSKLYHWWPPSNSWHQLDEDNNTSLKTINYDHLEIRTHIELSAGRWSDSGTIDLGIGYCLQSSINDYSFINNNNPLTSISLLSKVKLVPCAPINQW